MKKSPGTRFIDRVIQLFREEADTPSSPEANSSREHRHPSRSGGAVDRAGAAQDLPSEKARESNIDRYKHPSDCSNLGY